MGKKSHSKVRVDTLLVGTKIEETFIVTQPAISRMLSVCCDTNLLHLDDDFARSQGFESRIAPGMLLTGRISGLIARTFPDGTIAQGFEDLKFSRPAYPRKKVTISIFIKSSTKFDRDNKRVEMVLVLKGINQIGKTIISGRCTILVPLEK